MARLPVGAGYLSAFRSGIVLIRVGLGISQVAIATMMTTGMPIGYAGFASSALKAAHQLGTAFGLAILVGVATAGGGSLRGRVSGYRGVVAASAGPSVATTLLLRPSVGDVRAERTVSGEPVGQPAR